MPLPTHPFTISGGCTCNSIRYTVTIPAQSLRPQNPYRTPGVKIGDDDNHTIPFVAIDHCNDCRRATSSILPTALITEASTVMFTFTSKSVLPSTTNPSASAEQTTITIPATSLPLPIPQSHTQSIGQYNSSPGRTRYFCPQCGTSIGYNISSSSNIIPKEWNWPKMFDIWLGTVDRSDLEKEYMKPERMLWCMLGVGWIREFASRGTVNEIPEHPLTKIDRLVGDDVALDLEVLRKVVGKDL